MPINIPQRNTALIASRLRVNAERARASNPITNLPINAARTWSTGATIRRGDIYSANGNLYLCIASNGTNDTGTTAGSGTGPSATTNGPITDNNVTWEFFGYNLTGNAVLGVTPAPVITTFNAADDGTRTRKYFPLYTDAQAQTISGHDSNYKGGVGKIATYGGIGVVSAGNGDNYMNVASAQIGSVNNIQQSIIEFETDAPIFSLVTVYQQPYKMIVDGQYLDVGFQRLGLYGAGGTMGTTFNFTAAGGRRRRRIRFEVAAGFAHSDIGSVNMTANDLIWLPYDPDPIRAILVGDSFIQGGNNRPFDLYWPTILGHLMGWNDVWSSGIGGTGFTAGSPTYGTRLSTDVLTQSPDVVIISGSINDNTAGSTAPITAAALSVYQSIQSALPNALLIGSGVFKTNNSSQATTNEAALLSAANSAGIPFIPITNAADPWWFGTGHVDSTTGNGNTDFYVGSDNTHPVDAGNRYIATRYADEVRRIIQTLPTT